MRFNIYYKRFFDRFHTKDLYKAINKGCIDMVFTHNPLLIILQKNKFAVKLYLNIHQPQTTILVNILYIIWLQKKNWKWY